MLSTKLDSIIPSCSFSATGFPVGMLCLALPNLSDLLTSPVCRSRWELDGLLLFAIISGINFIRFDAQTFSKSSLNFPVNLIASR